MVKDRLLALLIILAFLLSVSSSVGVFLLYSKISSAEVMPSEKAVAKFSVDGDPFKGSKNAPVTIVEFSDFQCPYCARFAQQTLPLIEQNYIKTGKVKLVFKDFPLGFHANAKKASEAANCAGDQEKYWEYHDRIFQNQNALDIASLKKYAKDLGLDSSKFDACIDSGKYSAEIDEDVSEGQKNGVTGTPAFFVNGKSLVGAQPYAVFEQAINQALASK